MHIAFTPEFRARLKADNRYLSKRKAQQIATGTDYEMERTLGQDVLTTLVGWASCYYQDDKPYTDEWGIGWRPVRYSTSFGDGFYTKIKGHPLADDKAISSYKPPDPTRPQLYEQPGRTIEQFKDDYYIVGSTVCTIFEIAWALRGLERLMMDFLTDPDLANAILDIPFNYHLTAAKKLVEMGVDMIWTGDDVGTQKGMMLSPDLWRKILKPKMAQFFAELKAINPSIKLAYHSDGDIRPIIGDLIEIGLDVLNPIQPACMNPAELKQSYGDKLCFWGSIDEQHTLPFGSPDDVKNEVINRLNTIGKSGGLILGPTHHIQLDTPMDNFWAMVDTVTQTAYKC